MEELLDAYGARNNRRWFTLRRCVSAAKLFADLTYKFQHLNHSIPNYLLLPVAGDFGAETRKISQAASDLTLIIATQFSNTCQTLDIPNPEEDHCKFVANLLDTLPPGILMHDRKSRRVSSAEGTVAHLCTAFLYLAGESDLLKVKLNGEVQTYRTLIPDPVSEEGLRQLEQKFHSLQSLYDTHVSDTDTEILDPDLRVLRGHISVIYHLLEIAVGLCHYYERHVAVVTGDTTLVQREMVNPDNILQMLMGYTVTYAGRYLEAGRELCHTMLKRYAEISSVTVPVPRYRGFHVRPSTLVSKIILHYGSNVTMTIEGEEYDAGTPLELFRANEQINAVKRRQLASEVARMHLPARNGATDSMLAAVRQVVLELAALNKVMIYEHPLPLEELAPDETESLPEFVSDEIARLLALGKIDIPSELNATFTGDKRILKDIQYLAENGYGEDNFGNNIPLPSQLSYLRR
jgi:hypothetical protein